MSKILKFGGTSVGSAENMKKVAQIIQNQQSTITVLSAMSGTTDALVKIGRIAASGGDMGEVAQLMEMLRVKYSGCYTQLLEDTTAADSAMATAAANIYAEVERYDPELSQRVIQAQGELLTSSIFAMFLRQLGLKVELLNAPDFVFTDSQGKVDTALLKTKLAEQAIDSNTFYITQGFICTNPLGELDNLGRGGSDYSAALFGAAIVADEVQIWTDIDGMHNNDPRFVDHTYPLRKMSYNEAAELAYFGAKILHPATIQPCKDLLIPVRLKNAMDPDAEGTMISQEEDEFDNFHAVAAKDSITMIRICSTRMLMAYGFLRKVFEIFEEHRTPIDMITTSEVSVSLTIDNDINLDEIVRDLEPLGKIEIERENTIVCLIGHMEHDRVGLASKVMSSMEHVPVKMISYGASPRSITVLINTSDKKNVLQSINDKLFMPYVK